MREKYLPRVLAAERHPTSACWMDARLPTPSHTSRWAAVVAGGEDEIPVFGIDQSIAGPRAVGQGLKGGGPGLRTLAQRLFRGDPAVTIIQTDPSARQMPARSGCYEEGRVRTSRGRIP